MSGALGVVAGIGAGAAGTASEFSTVSLLLGTVTFADFEIPASMSGGGEQTMAVHKYPGGSRTVDTFGPDDADIDWSGIFGGLQAEQRCQQLDAMRRQGLVIPLTWSSFSYTVVIKSFTWKYERKWQIRYSIACTVVQDKTKPPATPGVSANDQVQSDGFDAATNSSNLSQVSYVQGGAH